MAWHGTLSESTVFNPRCWRDIVHIFPIGSRYIASSQSTPLVLQDMTKCTFSESAVLYSIVLHAWSIDERLVESLVLHPVFT